MLIQKGGITRNIDESRLHEYKAKGYVPLAVQEDPLPARAAGGGKRLKRPDVKE